MLASNRGVYLPEPVLVFKRQGWIQMDLSSSEMTDDIRTIVKEVTVEKTMLYEKTANYVQEMHDINDRELTRYEILY